MNIRPDDYLINRAHDMIESVLAGHVEGVVIDEDDLVLMIAQLNVLCWVLGHEGGRVFQDNLNAIEQAANEIGYKLEYMQRN